MQRKIFREISASFDIKKKLNIVLSFVLIIAVLSVIAANIIYNMTRYVPEFYKVSSNKISERVRVVFVTDLHLREYGKENKVLTEDIKNLSPDLILLGGDLVKYKSSRYENMLAFCKEAAKIAPTYGVWGNHEDIRMYIKKDKNLKKSFESTGVRFLTNEIENLKINTNSIVLCGIDGNAGNFEKYGAKEAAQKLDKMQGFKICVAHVPTYFSEKLAEYDFDMGLSGHTHGGVVNIPKIGPLYSREEGLFPKYVQGRHILKNDATLIISRGLGHSSIIPRINNIPELSVIDID